jgi:hypothetical protein
MDNPATFFFVFFAIFFAILGFGGGILTEYVNVRHMRSLAPYMKIFIWIACFFFLVACFMSLPNILGSAWILGTIAIIIFILLFKGLLQRFIPNIPNIGLNIQNITRLNMNMDNIGSYVMDNTRLIYNKFRQIVTQKVVLANAAINIGRP